MNLLSFTFGDGEINSVITFMLGVDENDIMPSYFYYMN